MKYDDLGFLNKFGAVFDRPKKRVELTFLDSEGNSSNIIGYFPSDNVQVLMYNINTKELPDLGMDFQGKGRYLRINLCKSGRCEFKDKSKKSAYLSAGDISMDYSVDNDGKTDFIMEKYVGIEIIMQVDYAINEIPTLAMLKKSIKRMDLPQYATDINTVYFIGASNDIKRITDELINYCVAGYDSEAIVIKISELGYSLGVHLMSSRTKLRTFADKSQIFIAEDIHKKLTEEYGEKWTVKMFAEKYGLSDTTINNYFKSVYDYGFKEYQNMVRMKKSAQLLEQTKMSISDISSEVGYLSQTKFGIMFKKYYGVTPTEYRRNAIIKQLSQQ